MDQDVARLQKCFSKIFPGLSPEQIASASVGTVRAWDSLASVTLLTLVSEEFNLTMDMDRFEEFTSFESLLKHIRATTPHA